MEVLTMEGRVLPAPSGFLCVSSPAVIPDDLSIARARTASLRSAAVKTFLEDLAAIGEYFSALKAMFKVKYELEKSIEKKIGRRCEIRTENTYLLCQPGGSVTMNLEESDNREAALLQLRGVEYDFDDLLDTMNCRKTQKWEAALLPFRQTYISQRPRRLGISTNHNKMTCSMKTSSEGGFDIEIGSYPIHVPKYSSVHHPLIQMVLFARTMYDDGTLTWLEFVASKRFVELNKSNLVITKPKSHSPNTVSARKDVHAHADAALENHSETPGLDKNIPMLGELDYNVDLSTVPVHPGRFPQENVCNLHSLTSFPNSADHGIAKGVDNAEVWPLPSTAAKAEDRIEVTWLMATAALHHATGNRDLLSGFTTIEDLFVKAGDGVSMPVCGRGSVITDTVVLPDVWFVPGITDNLVSATQLTELDYSVGFARGACIIKSATDGVVIGQARASEEGLFEVEFLKVRSVSAGE